MDKDIMRQLFPTEEARRAQRLCPTCGGSITDFRDSESREEYRISGMCQGCQDSVFDGEED